MMEGINGLELCQKIKGNIELCHIPIILITALISDESEIDGMQFGADAYVKKPFDIKVLEARVENLLHGRKVLLDKFIGADVDINKIEFRAELDKAFMEKVTAIVEGNLEESDFSVISLSRELGMSRPALYVKIKELTGKSPQEFIKLIKLQKAKKLLLLGQMTVMEVAFETGFNDAKYFSTTFKKHFGMSPSEVRSK
jgi:AraC-like DNA-binding protein